MADDSEMTQDEAVEDRAAESEQLDQLTPSDSLINRGLEDALDEGYTAPDNWSAAQGYGNTPAEMRRGESFEQRVVQEEPETPPRLRGLWNPDGESREVGNQRAGRLIAPGVDGEIDAEAESIAEDVGISGGAASAEEAAVHIIEDGQEDPEDIEVDRLETEDDPSID